MSCARPRSLPPRSRLILEVRRLKLNVICHLLIDLEVTWHKCSAYEMICFKQDRGTCLLGQGHSFRSKMKLEYYVYVCSRTLLLLCWLMFTIPSWDVVPCRRTGHSLWDLNFGKRGHPCPMDTFLVKKSDYTESYM